MDTAVETLIQQPLPLTKRVKVDSGVFTGVNFSRPVVPLRPLQATPFFSPTWSAGGLKSGKILVPLGPKYKKPSFAFGPNVKTVPSPRLPRPTDAPAAASTTTTTATDTDDMKVSVYVFRNDTDVHSHVNTHIGSMWRDDAVKLGSSQTNWPTIDGVLRNAVRSTILFFAAADGMIVENLDNNFLNELPKLVYFNSSARESISEFIHTQTVIECVHRRSYLNQLDIIISDRDEQLKALDDAGSHPAMTAKFNVIRKWFNKDIPLFYRIWAQACAEGIAFSSSFCFITFLEKQQPRLLPGFYEYNFYIRKDENMHAEFFMAMVIALREWVNEHGEEVDLGLMCDILHDFVEAEINFFAEGVGSVQNTAQGDYAGIPGMNVQGMRTHIQSLAEDMLSNCGFSPIYNSVTGFVHMNQQGMQPQTNFFEKEEHAYQLPTNATSGVVLTNEERLALLAGE